MGKFIKSNVESRFSSLLEQTHSASLFHTNHLIGCGIYLQPHQEHKGNSNTQITNVLMVFRGTGELRLTEQGEESLHLPIMSGDILVIPPQTVFSILNIGSECLMLIELSIS